MDDSKQEWKRVNIPIEQAEYIEKIIQNPKVKAKYAFRSIPDFVKRGISDLIERIEEEVEF